MSYQHDRSHRLPSFVIVGAMKAGTTTLHRLLVASGGIAIPDVELVLFDVDDPACHPRLHRQMLRGRPVTFEQDFDELFATYAAHFVGIPDEAVVGEDSTTYLYSWTAPERMRRVLGTPRVIVMLRDPVSRAISHYFHQVRARTTWRSMRRAIVEDPTILGRSTYVPGLIRYREVLGAHNVHVELLEDLGRDPIGVVERVRTFVGLGPAGYFEPVVANVGLYPSRVWPLLVRNWLVPARSLPNGSLHPPVAETVRGDRFGTRRVAGTLERVLGGPTRRWRHLDPQVERYLGAVLRNANAGLDELIGRDLSEVWPSWRQCREDQWSTSV